MFICKLVVGVCNESMLELYRSRVGCYLMIGVFIDKKEGGLGYSRDRLGVL